MRGRGALVLAAWLAATGCGPAEPDRTYTLEGQILAIRPEAGEVTIRHQDIEGFMPGMTMPFKVRDPSLLDGHRPGELIEATLVLRENEAWLSRITRTGEAPLPPPSELPVPGLAPGDPVPDATFTGDDGQPFRTRALQGHPAALTFVYTRCPLPDFCPAVDRRFAEVQTAIRSDPALGGARLVSISIDPAFDTPAVLRTHADRLEADPEIWRFVTGEPDAIDAFGRQFGLSVTRSSPSPADLQHNLRTVIVDRDGRITEIITGTGWSAGELVSALKRAAAPAS